MPRHSIKLSTRAKNLFDKGKLDRMFKNLGEQSGEWYLGRSQENLGHHAPLDRGFSQRGARTADYENYNPEYKPLKKGKNWLVQSGALLEYVRAAAKVSANPRSFKINVPVKPKGKGPAAYAGIHQHGGEIVITDKMRKFFWYMWGSTSQKLWKMLALAKGPIQIPKREYLRWDNVDTKSWRLFATKWLNVHLGFSKFRI